MQNAVDGIGKAASVARVWRVAMERYLYYSYVDCCMVGALLAIWTSFYIGVNKLLNRLQNRGKVFNWSAFFFASRLHEETGRDSDNDFIYNNF